MLPFLYRSDGFALPTYLVLNSLVFSLAVVWAAFKADRWNYDRNQVLDLCIWFMIGSFVGARAAHVLWEYPQVYLRNPELIFQFWLGGFVFYGGAVGAALGAYIFCRIKKLDFLRFADFLSPIISLCYAIGRFGCLAAGCCYGRPTNLPWGVKFPAGVEAPAGVRLHPTQVYASLMELIVFGMLLKLEKTRPPTGRMFGTWLMLHGIGRFIMEQFRDDFRGDQVGGLSISSWISIAVIGAGLAVLRRTQMRARTAPASQVPKFDHSSAE